MSGIGDGLGGRVVHRGVKLELRLVPLAAGDETVEKEVVVHGGAVVILPILDDGRMVFIRNERLAVQQELWELPAGTLAKGEDPVACAHRELKEETGYSADVMASMGHIYAAPGWSTERLMIYVARGLTAGEQQLEKDETIRVEIVSFEAVRAMIQKDEIVDAKTLAVMAMYAAKYGRIEM